MTPTVDEVLERLEGWRQRMVMGGWYTARDAEMYEAAGKMLTQRKASDEHHLRLAVEAVMEDR
jgi:hypothetical protein